MDPRWHLVLLAASFSAATSSSPVTCPSGNYCGGCPTGQSNWDTIHLMLGDGSPGLQELHASMAEALEMLRAMGPGIRTDDVHDAHMTVQYLCCLTPSQAVTAAEVIARHPFPKLSVRFQAVVCRTASFIIRADNQTQALLGGWVAAVEDSLVASGVPMTKRRATQAPFHATLATFGAEFAGMGAAAMAALNARFALNASAAHGFNSDPIAIDGAVLLPASLDHSKPQPPPPPPPPTTTSTATTTPVVHGGTRAFYTLFAPMLDSPDWPSAYEEYRPRR
jgi:hypothetical protein